MDAGVGRQPLQVGLMPGGETLVALRCGLEQGQAGIGGGAAEGVGREAVAVEEGAGVAGIAVDEALKQPFAGQGHPHRQEATGEALGEGHQVGLQAGPGAGEQGAAAAEAHHHLIGNQQGPRRPHPGLNRLQELGPHHGHAPGPLHQGLQDHGCGGHFQQLVQVVERLPFPLLHRVIAPPGGRPGAASYPEQQGLKRGGKQRSLPHAHRPHRVAVIGALKGDQLLAGRPLPSLRAVVPPLPGDFERHLHGGGAVVGEEQALQAAEGRQLAGQGFGGRMAEIGEDHLLQLVGLGRNRGGNRRFAVAVQGHPPAADRIDQQAAVV